MRVQGMGLLAAVTLLAIGHMTCAAGAQDASPAAPAYSAQATAALVLAVRKNQFKATLRVLQDGADPNATDAAFHPASLPPSGPEATLPRDPISPVLALAAEQHNEAILTALGQAGANVDAASSESLRSGNQPALMEVVNSVEDHPRAVARDLRMARRRLDYGADANAMDLVDPNPNITTPIGETPLLMAAFRGRANVRFFALLIAHGAQVNYHDGTGRTPLTFTIEVDGGSHNPSAAGVRCLLAHGALLHDETVSQERSLSAMLCAADGGTEVDMTALIAGGGDVNERVRRDGWKSSGLLEAQQAMNRVVIALLERARAHL